MARYLSSQPNKMRNVQLSSRKKYRSIILCKSKRKNDAQKIVLNSLTDETFVTQNNELVEFTAQFADKLKVSPSLHSMRWKKDVRHNKISAGEDEVQAASSSSEAVKDNMGDITQDENISQISLSPESKTKIKNHLSTIQRKNILIEEKDDNTAITSTNNKCKTKSLNTNQVGYVYSKFFYNFFHY